MSYAMVEEMRILLTEKKLFFEISSRDSEMYSVKALAFSRGKIQSMKWKVHWQ